MMTLFPDANFSIMCVYNGIPLPDLQWKHNSITITESVSGIVIVTSNETSVLIVEDMMSVSEGIYICQATNVAGISSLNFTIECKCFI